MRMRILLKAHLSECIITHFCFLLPGMYQSAVVCLRSGRRTFFLFLSVC